MADSELFSLAPLILTALVQALVTAGLFAWGRWVARRQRGPWWGRAAWLPLLGLGVAVVGIALTAVFVVQAFDSVASVDPARRASLLSDAIGRAMIATALSAPLSGALYLASLVVFSIGSIRRPRPPATAAGGAAGGS